MHFGRNTYEFLAFLQLMQCNFWYFGCCPQASGGDTPMLPWGWQRTFLALSPARPRVGAADDEGRCNHERAFERVEIKLVHSHSSGKDLIL